MYIEKIETGFSSVIYIGRYSIFIFTKKDGVFISLEEIYQKCMHFNNVIITGDEPLLQKEEIGKLCKKLVKNNPNINLEIYTMGRTQPSEVNSYKDNINFYVYVELSSSKKLYKDRIIEDSFIFFNEFGAYFIFKVEEKEDFEDVISITKSFGVKKSQTYLTSENYDFNYLIKQAKFYGFNIEIPVILND